MLIHGKRFQKKKKKEKSKKIKKKSILHCKTQYLVLFGSRFYRKTYEKSLIFNQTYKKIKKTKVFL